MINSDWITNGSEFVDSQIHASLSAAGQADLHDTYIHLAECRMLQRIAILDPLMDLFRRRKDILDSLPVFRSSLLIWLEFVKIV
jgi:hypothetical protein